MAFGEGSLIMRLLAVAVLMLSSTAASAVALPNDSVVKGALPPGSDTCPQTTSYYAFRSGEPLKPRKLTELPPANAFAAVYRHIGRCEIPLVVKYGVGRR
jgi:hypothetical protein